MFIIIFVIQTPFSSAVEFRIISESYDTEWINSSFDDSSIWNFDSMGDDSDVEFMIDDVSKQAEITIVGDRRTFNLINSTPHVTDWIAVPNPLIPNFPDYYEINSSGFHVSHNWNEELNSTSNNPSVRWARNINMQEDMSDFEITSVNLSAVFNAAVEDRKLNLTYFDSSTSEDNGGIEVTGDGTLGYWYNITGFYPQYGFDPQFASGDFARFYILMSDLDNNKEYQVAFNQTIDLGQDDPAIITIPDSLINVVDENALIFYLSSALGTDNHNFSISVGIDIYCEDNVYGADIDYWKSLIIKSVNFSFTYEKKINQLNSVSLTSTSNALNEDNYINLHPGSPSLTVNTASFNFIYSINREWPISSPNSEFRYYINDIAHTETTKLSNGLITWQNASINDFNILNLIQKDENISLTLQIYLADNFLLGENIQISIDDVKLRIGYTVTWTEEVSAINWIPLIVILLMAIVILIGGFASYQFYFRFPPMVRDIKKIRGKIDKERETEQMDVMNRDAIVEKILDDKLKETNITAVKTKKIEYTEIKEDLNLTEEKKADENTDSKIMSAIEKAKKKADNPKE